MGFLSYHSVYIFSGISFYIIFFVVDFNQLVYRILGNCFKELRTKEVTVPRFLTFRGWLRFCLSERSPGALATSVSQLSGVSLCLLLLLLLRLDDVLESFKTQQSGSSSWKADFIRAINEI